MNICFMDSGVGGYATYLAFCDLIAKNEYKSKLNLLYFADFAHSPYGSKSRKEICNLLCRNVESLFKAHAIDIFVLACNTATACAIKELRARFPSIKFVGVEPAIKQATASSKSVLVLTTSATYFHSAYIHSHINKGGNNNRKSNAKIYFLPLTSTARKIDTHINDLKYLSYLAQQLLAPFIPHNIRNIVLGCTHYNFLAPHILALFPNAHLFEPSRAVARQVFSQIKVDN